MADLFLGFDSGTTNTKAFLYDDRLVLKAAAARPTGLKFPRPGWAEQPADDWFLALARSLRGLKTRLGTIGLAGSSQGGTFVPLDRNGRPLRPAVTWLDNRAPDIAAELNRRFGAGRFYRKTGWRLYGGSPLTLCRWLQQEEPEVWRHTRRLAFVADYLNYRLTGEFFLDSTSAAMTNLFNIRTGRWDPELLDLAGLKSSMLPEVIPADACGGRLTAAAARQLGLSAGTPVFAGGHDQYCAALGAGAAAAGTALVSCGTAWVILITTRRPVYDPARRLAPGPHLLPGRFGLMGAASNGGILYDWFSRNLKQTRPAEGETPSPVLVLPNFIRGRGGLLNLGLADGPAEILRAVMETLGLQIREYLDLAAPRLGGDRVRKLVAIGGPVRQTSLPRLLADITGLEVTVPEISEAAGRGAARLALAGLSGRHPESRFKLAGRRFRPHPGRTEAYVKKYELYRRLKRQLEKEGENDG